MHSSKKKILVAPLDWGLGHATRCVPVIRELLRNDADVIIAADGLPMDFLHEEFPQIEKIRLAGYGISYPGPGEMMAVKMLKQIPKILWGIRKENKWLTSFIKKNKINAVISDQRFGLYTNLLPCAFISHQVMVKSPYLESILFQLNKGFIKKYDECWIPDFKTEVNLSGDLSHKYALPLNAKFIGPLSRFSALLKSISSPVELQYDIMLIISGPEPQRTLLEKSLLPLLKKSNYKSVVVRGLTDRTEHEKSGNVEVFSHLNSHEMMKYMLSSKVIIARSGYSTIMDLATLNKKAILIPTEGQTEQEYLAQYHSEKSNFFSVRLEEFNLETAFQMALSSKGNMPRVQNYDLEEVVFKFTLKC